ncbi:MAG: helix-turn-helix domain-containing protein [Firmicutes bacterium]|nr:helix-turn-helix domain-containing protein [Bacillota bacterium]
MKTYFAKVLKELMTEHNFTIEELGIKLNASQSQINNWLNSKDYPGYWAIKDISDFFNVSADMLLDTKYCDE